MANDTFRMLVKQGNNKEAKDYAKENKKLIADHLLLSGAREALSTGHKIITLIHNNRNMSAAEKRKQIDKMYLNMIKIARQGIKTVKKRK